MVTGATLMLCFIAAVLILLISIIKFKLNPFIALLLTSIITGFLVKMPIADVSTTISSGFGGTMSSIGIVIGLGVIFGSILSEARATEAIAKGLLKVTGNKNAALAVTTAGFLISIPVFMDAAFVIMMPIVKYVAKVTKKSLMIFVCALGVGTIVGHALVIPTPGPLAVAANMNADVAPFILYSLVAGFIAILFGGWVYGKRFESYAAYEGEADNEISAEDSTIPGFGLSMFSLLFPICLILVSNIIIAVIPEGTLIYSVAAFLGDKNIALLLGVIVSFFALKNYFQKSFSDVVVEAADSAGLILLITGAGGAFGSVINASGIGTYLVDTMSNLNIPAVVLGFVLSALLRVSQGSTTVAIVTTSSILGPAIASTAASPVLVGLAICAGGIGFSLPNDSGFWVLNRFSGITVSDTLKSWTMGGTIASITAFAVILILNMVYTTVGLPLL